MQRYPLHDARDVPRAIRPAAAPRASPRRSSRASRRGSTRVPRATSSTPTDDAADKRKNPALYDGSLHTAAADDASRVALASRARAAGRKPEILAPAGGWPQMRAAVEAGADAVYFGLNLLNARARAANSTSRSSPTSSPSSTSAASAASSP